jgi:hypothetical protein
VRVKITLIIVVIHFVSENHTLRLKITLMSVEITICVWKPPSAYKMSRITLVRVKITLLRVLSVEITLMRVLITLVHVKITLVSVVITLHE